MNATSLLARVQRRVPGYDSSEYLDEINAAYKECWDAICQLDDSYFTDIKVVNVATAASEFDFLYNANGNLSANISFRYFQIDMLRVNQPGDTNWIPCNPRNWNSPDVLAVKQDSTQPVQTAPPYLFTQFSKGSFKFARPLPAGTQIEVTYSFKFQDLVILSNGTVTSSGTAITGTSTNFTQIVGEDYQQSLPGPTNEDTEVGVELVIGPQTTYNAQTYRVSAITTDTALTTINAPTPALTGSNYALASVPDIPDGHHNVISTIATRNFMSTPAGDPRVNLWAALAEKEIGSMKDSIMTRQRLEPARRGRFPFGLTRYSSYPSVSR